MGLAWDSVTRITLNGDSSSLQPGSFDSDYSAAASAAPPNFTIPFVSHDRIAAAEKAQQLMKSGLAERHYVAGMKERTDDVSSQTATIVDCAARTVTTLDLKAKTYRVVPMEAPSSHGSGGGDESNSGADRDGRMAVSLTNTALGAREVGGQATNGFRSEMVFTETNSSGESHTQNGDLVGYYSNYANPSQACGSYRSPSSSQSMGNLDMIGGFARAMRVLSSAGNSRFTIKQSGPPLPLGKLAMYSAMLFSGQGHMGAFITERGNVRPIDANDPVFSVPSDFTRQQ
jgi:hypothetical protein